MLSAERKLRIAEIINKNGGIKTSDLSELFKVSDMTVLRDLATLEEKGILTRVYGGAVSAKRVPMETSNIYREKLHTLEKNKIASIAVGLVKEGDSIFLDGSTTSLALARRLINFNKVTVITVGLDIINELKEYENVNLICPGGELDTVTMNFLGRNTEIFLKNYNTEKAFISTSGLSVKAGLTELNPLQSFIKKMMIENSTHAALLIDYSKFGQIALNRVCDLASINTVVTDKKPGRDYMEFFRENNIELLF